MALIQITEYLITSSLYVFIHERLQLRMKYKLHCTNWAKLKHVLNMQDCCTIFHAIAIRSEGRQPASSIWPVERYKAHESKLSDSILLNHVTLN